MSVIIATSAVADDIVLKDGRVFANATIIKQAPRTVTIKYASGLASVAKELLPPELQVRYPIDEAAAREAEQSASLARETAQKAQAAEKESLAKLRSQHEVTAAAQKVADEKDAAQLEAKKDAVKSDVRFAAIKYFEQNYATVPDTTPEVTVTINEVHPIEGWSGRWLAKGQAIIRRFKNHDIELSRLYSSQPADAAGQEKRLRQIRFLESDYTREFVEFECTYPTDSSAPSFEIRMHTQSRGVSEFYLRKRNSSRAREIVLSQQIRSQLSQPRALAFRQLHMGVQRLSFHPVVAIDQSVAARVNVWIVDLRGITDQDDF